MNYSEKFEVRDLRVKEKFQIDDEYLNGYARLCGWKGTIAYMSLCRHANFKTQISFPSIKRMSDQHKVSRDTIIDGIRVLQEWNIVAVKEATGKVNVYILLDKSKWRVKPNQSTTATSRPQRLVADIDGGSRPQRLVPVDHSDTKESNLNVTNKGDGESLKKLREQIGSLKDKKGK